MKELELKITGVQSLGETIVSIDDKPVKIDKKNEFGNLVYKYSTENDKVNIKVYRLLDVGGFWWFVTQLFFFLISIFGLLDIHRREKCLVVDFEAEVDLKEQENRVILQFNTPQENVKAVSFQTNLTSQEISNKYIVDAKAKKKRKALMLTKIFLAVAIVISVAVVLIVKL